MITTGDIENGLWTIAKQISAKVYIYNRPKVLSAVSDYVVCGIATDISSLVDNTNGSIAGTNVFLELYAKDIDDVGFGFGKTLEHNVLLMQHLDDLLQECDTPLLVGVSRKRMIGDLTGETVPSERVHGSVAAALAAVARGAQIIRVHDVKATADAVKVWQAVGGKII